VKFAKQNPQANTVRSCGAEKLIVCLIFAGKDLLNCVEMETKFPFLIAIVPLPFEDRRNLRSTLC
jgi:hypothetical protein